MPARKYDYDLACNLYVVDGLSTNEISQKLKCDVNTVTKILNIRGIPLRKSTYRQYPLDEHAFDSITEESAYWVGFIMADGNINEHSGSKYLSVELAEKDEKHVEKLRNFLKTDKPIYKSTKTTQSKISVGSSVLCEALERYGVTPRKSLTAKVSENLVNNRHFWRGEVDGDGHVSISKSGFPVIALCGSDDMMVQFVDFIKNIYPPYAGSARKNGKVSQVHAGSQSAIAVIKYLYGDCSIYLDRKKIVADDILSKVCPCCYTWLGNKAHIEMREPDWKLYSRSE